LPPMLSVPGFGHIKVCSLPPSSHAILLSVIVSKFHSSYKDTSHWIMACLVPVWPHLTWLYQQSPYFQIRSHSQVWTWTYNSTHYTIQSKPPRSIKSIFYIRNKMFFVVK
jgi:hypothetical protein